MSARLEDLLVHLRAMKPLLRERFGVQSIAVFGSFARGAAKTGSDLDILLRFEPNVRPTLFTLSDLDALLEKRLGLAVDTVPESCVNPRMAPYISAHLVEV
jgi:hypothetical protein